MKKIILLLLFSLFLSACGNDSNKPVTKISSNQVEKALEFNKVEAKKIKSKTPALQKVKPVTYDVDQGYLHLYLFSSEEQTEKAVKEFQEKKSSFGWNVPKTFHARNILLVYTYEGKDILSPQFEKVTKDLLQLKQEQK